MKEKERFSDIWPYFAWAALVITLMISFCSMALKSDIINEQENKTQYTIKRNANNNVVNKGLALLTNGASASWESYITYDTITINFNGFEEYCYLVPQDNTATYYKLSDFTFDNSLISLGYRSNVNYIKYTYNNKVYLLCFDLINYYYRDDLNANSYTACPITYTLTNVVSSYTSDYNLYTSNFRVTKNTSGYPTYSPWETSTTSIEGFLNKGVVYTSKTATFLCSASRVIYIRENIASGGGYEDGYTAGYEEGYEEGVYEGERNVINNPHDYDLYDSNDIDIEYDTGYNLGYQNGFNEGYENGETNGFNEGYEEGRLEDMPLGLEWVESAFNVVTSFLNITILPNVTLGHIFAGVIILIILAWVLAWFRG